MVVCRTSQKTYSHTLQNKIKNLQHTAYKKKFNKNKKLSKKGVSSFSKSYQSIVRNLEDSLQTFKSCRECVLPLVLDEPMIAKYQVFITLDSNLFSIKSLRNGTKRTLSLACE